MFETSRGAVAGIGQGANQPPNLAVDLPGEADSGIAAFAPDTRTDEPDTPWTAPEEAAATTHNTLTPGDEAQTVPAAKGRYELDEQAWTGLLADVMDRVGAVERQMRRSIAQERANAEHEIEVLREACFREIEVEVEAADDYLKTKAQERKDMEAGNGLLRTELEDNRRELTGTEVKLAKAREQLAEAERRVADEEAKLSGLTIKVATGETNVRTLALQGTLLDAFLRQKQFELREMSDTGSISGKLLDPEAADPREAGQSLAEMIISNYILEVGENGEIQARPRSTLAATEHVAATISLGDLLVEAPEGLSLPDKTTVVEEPPRPAWPADGEEAWQESVLEAPEAPRHALPDDVGQEQAPEAPADGVEKEVAVTAEPQAPAEEPVIDTTKSEALTVFTGPVAPPEPATVRVEPVISPSEKPQYDPYHPPTMTGIQPVPRPSE